MLKIVAKLEDDFGNIAIIDYRKAPAYQGGKTEDCFRVSLFAEYDNNYLYHVSVYDSLETALSKLSKLSAGTFKEEVKQ